jgi:hypothetical protein
LKLSPEDEDLLRKWGEDEQPHRDPGTEP